MKFDERQLGVICDQLGYALEGSGSAQLEAFALVLAGSLKPRDLKEILGVQVGARQQIITGDGVVVATPAEVEYAIRRAIELAREPIN